MTTLSTSIKTWLTDHDPEEPQLDLIPETATFATLLELYTHSYKPNWYTSLDTYVRDTLYTKALEVLLSINKAFVSQAVYPEKIKQKLSW